MNYVNLVDIIDYILILVYHTTYKLYISKTDFKKKKKERESNEILHVQDRSWDSELFDNNTQIPVPLPPRQTNSNASHIARGNFI